MSAPIFTAASAASIIVHPDDLVFFADPTTESRTRDTASGTGTATAALQFINDGTFLQYGNESLTSDTLSTPTDFDGTTWFSDQPRTGIGSDYELFVGTPTETGGTAGVINIQPTNSTWLSLSTTRTFEIEDTGNNVQSFYTVEWPISIRNASTLDVIISSATLRLQAFLIGP